MCLTKVLGTEFWSSAKEARTAESLLQLPQNSQPKYRYCVQHIISHMLYIPWQIGWICDIETTDAEPQTALSYRQCSNCLSLKSPVFLPSSIFYRQTFPLKHESSCRLPSILTMSRLCSYSRPLHNTTLLSHCKVLVTLQGPTPCLPHSHTHTEQKKTLKAFKYISHSVAICLFLTLGKNRP